MNKVMMISTSLKTRGGITSVLKSYKSSKIWSKWNCILIETHIDRTIFQKIFFFLKAFILFLNKVNSVSIVHIHLSGLVSLIRKTPFILISKILKRKIIIHFHAFSSNASVKRNHSFFYRIIFNLADKIIVLSNSWKNGVATDLGLDENKLTVLYNPCSPLKERLINKEEKYILFAGTLNKRKNYEKLIYAFSKIHKKNNSWKLIFAGNGEIERAKKITKNLKIKNKVIFKGWVTGKEKHNLFLNASIFCLPSHAEGFPMAVLDAWSYGLPVMSSPVGGIMDVAIHEKNIIIINPNEENDIANKIEMLIRDQNLMNKLSIESINFAENFFSLTSVTSKLDKIYSEIL